MSDSATPKPGTPAPSGPPSGPTHPTPTAPSPTGPGRPGNPPATAIGPFRAGFRIGDIVSIVDDRPGATVWRITAIVTDNPEHDGPYAKLAAVDGSGDSWSALRILRPAGCNCGHGDLEEMWHLGDCPRTGRPIRLPALAQLIHESERLGARMIDTLGRQFDPGSVSEDEAWPGMLMADLNLARAVSCVREALRALHDLAELAHPPVSVEVTFPTRPTPGPVTAALPSEAAVDESPGGPPSPGAGADHPSQAGVRPTPGSAAALSGAVSESAGDLVDPGAGDNVPHNCGCSMCRPRVSSW